MTSRVPWSVEAIEPSARDRAEAAARRAGMSLNDWLETTGGTQAARGPADVSEIHHRLDSITRQIERMSQIATPKPEGGGVARELNEAISRLDARLAQITQPPAGPQAPPPQAAAQPQPQRQAAEPPRATARPEPAPVYRQAPTTIPELLDFDVAEIIARQNQLNSEAPPARLSQAAAAMVPPPPAPVAAPDLSAFERQLQHLTSQIESLRRPDGTEQAIAAFRSELADIRNIITEALPRRALESLEGEIRAVAQRIDASRQSGVDGQVLQNIEHALRDIHTTLLKLTPAEQLAGFDDAIRNLGDKIDVLVRANPDAGSVQQLEGAIGALRAIVSNVASNEALSRLSEEVHRLASKIDQVSQEQASQSGGFAGSLAALEQRIAVLTTALETRERPADDGGHLEAAVRMLSDRIDHLQVGSDTSSAFAHVEQRIMQLLERLETVDSRTANFSRVEDGLSEILRQLEQQRISFASLSDGRGSASAMDQDAVGAIRRELSDLRHSQSETDRNTQDALESVHNTLGHVVDRLAMIETDLRDNRAARPAAQDKPAPFDRPAAPAFAGPDRLSPQAAPPLAPLISSTAISAPMPAAARPATAMAPPPRSDLPNPVAAQTAAPPPNRTPPMAPPPAIQDILTAAASPERPSTPGQGPQARSPINPDLPPDYPLEPGTRPQERAAAPLAATPSQRIAASESVLSEIPNAAREAASTSSFIAAARRAAQAASNPAKDQSKEKPGRVAALNNAARATAQAAKSDSKGNPKGDSKITSRIRSLLVGASVVVIVLSGFRMAMTMLDGGSHTPPAAEVDKPIEKPLEKSSDASPTILFDPGRAQQTPELTLPSMTSPTPLNRQSQASAPAATPAPTSDTPDAGAATAAPADAKPAAPDVTGSITVPPAGAKPAMPYAPVTLNPVSDTLPDTIGGPVLRSAALKGDPAAAYEVAVRFAEGKGVPVDYGQAVKWYDRAADAGIVPAMFRLGTLYEKGLGGNKDVDAARRYYIRAADRGNAKAMHNLAVLDADGGNKGPNYKSAAQWFRKAAEHGVADSQFNLAILYARGIGVEQNLAESYKWFSLAASQGDADASRKRDDIARRLDAQSLAAAKLALQTFSPEKQPDDALNVPAPAGGWDAVPAAPAPAAAVKRHGKPAAKLTTAAR